MSQKKPIQSLEYSHAGTMSTASTARTVRTLFAFGVPTTDEDPPLISPARKPPVRIPPIPPMVQMMKNQHEDAAIGLMLLMPLEDLTREVNGSTIFFFAAASLFFDWFVEVINQVTKMKRIVEEEEGVDSPRHAYWTTFLPNAFNRPRQRGDTVLFLLVRSPSTRESEALKLFELLLDHGADPRVGTHHDPIKNKRISLVPLIQETKSKHWVQALTSRGFKIGRPRLVVAVGGGYRN